MARICNRPGEGYDRCRERPRAEPWSVLAGLLAALEGTIVFTTVSATTIPTTVTTISLPSTIQQQLQPQRPRI